MGEPFRDEMSAALTRAEKLAEENQDLREELKRLRVTAHSVRAQEPDHELANQTLAVLDRLEEATHVDALSVKPPAPIEAERADLSTLTQTADQRWSLDISKPTQGLPSPSLPSPPPLRRTGVRRATLVAACFVCLFIGIVLGAMIR